jgi:hypothetical protein
MSMAQPWNQRVDTLVSRVLPIYLLAILSPHSIAAAETEPARKPNSESVTWSVYFPVHMPGLDLTVPEENGEELKISADVLDLAKQANSFFALGIRYDFHVLNRQLWLDFNGWHGGYDLGKDDLTAKLKPPPKDRDLVDITVDMVQRIAQAEAGVWLGHDWRKLDLGLFTGARYYDQEIKVSGDVAILSLQCRVTDCADRENFKQENNVSWAEAILGVSARYHWHGGSVLAFSFSYGHDGSSRIQGANTWTFAESWFGSLGWRRDAFESDGVDIVENGAYFDIGKRF